MKCSAHAEYKDSCVEWLGEFPVRWKLEKFKYLFQVSNEKNGMEPVGQMLSVSGYRGVEVKEYNDEAKKRTPEEVSEYRVVRKGQLVVNTMWLNYSGLGVSDYEGYISPAYRAYRFTKNVNKKYIHHLLRSNPYVMAYSSQMQGIRPNSLQIKTDDFQSLPVLLPSIAEQECIAKFLDYELDKIDLLIGKQIRLIELLKEKRQAMISHAVTKGLNSDVKMRSSGIEWLGDIPEHWNIVKFSYCVSIRSGLVDPKSEQYKKYWLIAPNHIQSGEGRIFNLETAEEQGAESSKYLCKEGEVIYSKIRPALAKACISPGNNVLCSADMYPMTACSGLKNNYLLWFLLSSIFTRFAVNQADRVAMPKINRESLAECKIPFPGKSEQIKIAYYLQRITKKLDDLIVKSQESICLLKERRSALISAAVTGKIDVRHWQPNAKDVA